MEMDDVFIYNILCDEDICSPATYNYMLVVNGVKINSRSLVFRGKFEIEASNSYLK